MAAYSGPEIPNSGLVYNLDAANPKNFDLDAVQVLVVAGGGGGGTGGGGGGGGGVIYNPNFSVIPGTALTVTVGAGGTNTSVWGGDGGAGGNSIFGSLTAIGGGAGGHRYSSSTQGTGGSGGGNAGGTSGSGTVVMSNGTTNQGFTGGSSIVNGTTQEEPGGGGGGAGGPGFDSIIPASTSAEDARSALPGAGGLGLSFDISGTLTWYAGGGGGSNRNGVGAAGGGGGGGAGGASPVPGGANTGGGGGGTGYSGYGGGGTSALGGSGIVIVRYRGPQRAVGGTVTRVGNDTVHTFTSSGTFTPLSTSSLLGLPDYSGNSYFATVNGPTFNSDNNGSIVFDGSNDNVNIGNQSNLNMGTGDFSLECIFKANGSSAYRLLLQKGNPGVGVNRGYRIRIEINNTVQLTVTGDAEYTATSSAITYNTYYHVMATKDASNLKIYLNGSLSGTGTSPAGTTSNTNDFIIGLSDSGNWPFNGNISQVKIYNRALTSAEIAQLFNASRGRYGI